MSISLNQDSQKLWFICCTNLYASSSKHDNDFDTEDILSQTEQHDVFALILFYSLLVMLENNIPVSNSIKKFDVFSMLQDILEPFTVASSSYHYLNSKGKCMVHIRSMGQYLARFKQLQQRFFTNIWLVRQSRVYFV